MSSSKNKRSRIKPILYNFLAFSMAFILFAATGAIILKATVFSRDYMITTMGDTGYYPMVKDEFRTHMKNLGHASGLSDEFVDEFTEEIDFRMEITQYIESFYSGEKTLVNTTSFKQTLKNKVNRYIEDNHIDKEKASEADIDYMISEATDIYVRQISIPFFSVIANYIHNLSTPLTITIVVLILLAAGIGCILYFTNEYKHRRYRYLCYAFTTAFLLDTIIPSFIFITGIIGKVNLATRSLYSLFVGYFTGMFSYFYLFAGFNLLMAVVCFFLFYTSFKKAIGKA